MNTSSLTHAHGSAVVRIGESAVVVGVRGEVLNAVDTQEADDDDDSGRRDEEKIATLGLLVPNIEVNTGCHPSLLPGGAPGVMVQGLTHRLLTLLRASDLVGLKELCIYDGDEQRMAGHEDEEQGRRQRVVRAYFTLYIDIWFLSLSGSAFDVAWLAVLAALMDTRLPAARWDADVGGVLCDPRQENYFLLVIRSFPVALSWCVFAGSGRNHRKKINAEEAILLVDPDDFEESCCEEAGIVVVDYHDEIQKIIRVEKTGGGVVGVGELKNVLDVAKERWIQWKDLLKEI